MIESIQEILTNPKVTTAVVASTATQSWWLDWGLPLIEDLTKVGSFILVIIMILLQLQKYMQTRRKNKIWEDVQASINSDDSHV